MKRLHILVLAEENNPEWVSVPLVGYHQTRALAALHDVTLVTHRRNMGALSRSPTGASETIPIGLGPIDSFWEWLFHRYFKSDPGSQNRTVARIPFYICFELIAWIKLRGRIKAGEFDVVLRVTPVSPVVPSLFARVMSGSSVPFVVGPLNGGLPMPRGFEASEKQHQLVSKYRHLYRRLPFSKATFVNAKAVIAGSSWTFEELSDRCLSMFLVPENGIPETGKGVERGEREGVLRLVFIGRLVPFKGCDLAIKAAAQSVKSGRASLRIYGEGPEQSALEELVRELRIEDGVEFMGTVPHARLMHDLNALDVLIFPSLREFGGGVVFEALAHGVVPVVLDYGGPSDIVYDGVGFKLPLQGAEQIVSEIERVINRLDSDRSCLRMLSDAGVEYARSELTWEGKARRISEILLWATGRQSTAPPERLLRRPAE